jgi:hypothetical protein
LAGYSAVLRLDADKEPERLWACCGRARPSTLFDRWLSKGRKEDSLESRCNEALEELADRSRGSVASLGNSSERRSPIDMARRGELERKEAA